VVQVDFKIENFVIATAAFADSCRCGLIACILPAKPLRHIKNLSFTIGSIPAVSTTE
jgi:hypothetical protein